MGRFHHDMTANYTEALYCFERAYTIRQKLIADTSHNDLARSQFMLGTVHKYLGDYATALLHLQLESSLDTLAVMDVNSLQLNRNELTVLSACNTGTCAL